MTAELPPPNIVFILSDDQGSWALRCAGTAELHTPNLDRIAAEGIRFENFFCVSPVCSPARASILTGRIPSRHGVHDWLAGGDTSDTSLEPLGKGRLTEYLAGQPGYTDILSQNGYVCGLSGKWHLGDSHHPQKGHTFWEVHAKGGSSYYNAPMVRDGEVYYAEGYFTDVVTDNALAFLNRHGTNGTPFYLGVHYTAPHGPWGREHHPHAVWDRYFENATFAANPTTPRHPWGIPALFPDNEQRRRTYLAGYYAAIEEMDRNIGRLLDWLEANGQRENTLIVFTSDNGMSMGHHGIYGKGNGTDPLNMYDTAVKVPALMSQPGRLPAGLVSDRMLSHYDIFPTLLDYLGLPNPHADELPGHSFAPLLRGEAQGADSDVVIFDEYGPTRMIRTREWKLVLRHPDGPNELYHLAADPGEEHNLVDDPAHRVRREALSQQMKSWFARYAEAGKDGFALPVSGRGQIGPIEPGAVPTAIFKP